VKQGNPVGLAALIVAAVAFVFAIVPFLSFVAWLPALGAIVLGIVGLVLKGRKRGLALAGLILGVVAWIIAIIVSLAGVAGVVNAIDEEISSTVAPLPPVEEAEEGAAEEPATAEAGSRANPVPLGSAIESADWTVVVNSYNADATTAVSGANQFNQPAPDGSTYALVNYTVTYKGEDSAYANFVQVKLVTESGEVLDDFTNPVVLEDGFSLDELYAGGSVTGSTAIAVPNGAPVLIRVTPGVVAEDKFVQP
jgi:hypothetical protein